MICSGTWGVGSDLFSATAAVLQCSDLQQKLSGTTRLLQRWRAGELDLEETASPQITLTAGRPAQPELVAPRRLRSRRLGTAAGHAAMIHAIAHIEFNAINLALDAVYRFRQLPRDYYDDWLRIADEERHHFQLITERLQQLGYHYGDFPAHNGLWERAEETATDPLLRMALVPRLLEARGLDVNPMIMEKLYRIGDHDTLPILEVILQDEIGHVEAGTVWFRHLCAERGVEPDGEFEQLVRSHMAHTIRAPFHRQGRIKAGFSERELAFLDALDRENRCHGSSSPELT